MDSSKRGKKLERQAEQRERNLFLRALIYLTIVHWYQLLR
jgi:hypothetical protein